MQRWLHIAGCIYAAIRIYSCVQSPSPNNLIILHPHVCAKIFRHGKLQEFRITFKNSISVSHPLLQRSVNNNAYIYLLMFRYSVRKIWANFCSIVWNGKRKIVELWTIDSWRFLFLCCFLTASREFDIARMVQLFPFWLNQFSASGSCPQPEQC